MKFGGYGQYTEINRVKDKMKDVKSKDYHDVYGPEMTDWTSAYKTENIDPTEFTDDYPVSRLKCIKKSIDDDYEELNKEYFDDYDDNETFWYDNPNILFKKERLFDVLPNKKQTYEENVNALTRLGIFISIGIAYSYGDLKYLLLIVLVLLFTLFIYTNKIYNLKDFISTIEVKYLGKSDNKMIKKKDKPNNKSKENFLERNPEDLHAETTLYKKTHKLGPNEIRQVMDTPEGRFGFPLNKDMLCADVSQNETTGGYDWIKQSNHADFRSNGRLSKTTDAMRDKLYTDISDSYGKEIAERNSFIANHPRDYINTNPEQFFYGKNLDRRLYYGRR